MAHAFSAGRRLRVSAGDKILLSVLGTEAETHSLSVGAAASWEGVIRKHRLKMLLRGTVTAKADGERGAGPAVCSGDVGCLSITTTHGRWRRGSLRAGLGATGWGPVRSAARQPCDLGQVARRLCFQALGRSRVSRSV